MTDPRIVFWGDRRGGGDDAATVDDLFAALPATLGACGLRLRAGGTVEVACYCREQAAHDAMLAGETFVDVELLLGVTAAGG